MNASAVSATSAAMKVKKVPNDTIPFDDVGRWAWVGSGWRSAGDAWLASVFQRERDQSRVCARDESRVDVASSKGRESWL